MSIRSILGLDLAGRLLGFKRRYKGNTRLFDHTTIWCSVSKWSNGTASAGASAYCSDPSATGLDTQPIARFYSSKVFSSISGAEAHLSAEVARAFTKFPKSDFYRHGAKGAEDKMQWVDGRWQAVSEMPSHHRCRGCGYETQEHICSNCGELVF